jgi:hypothetical protein
LTPGDQAAEGILCGQLEQGVPSETARLQALEGFTPAAQGAEAGVWIEPAELLAFQAEGIPAPLINAGQRRSLAALSSGRDPRPMRSPERQADGTGQAQQAQQAQPWP